MNPLCVQTSTPPSENPVVQAILKHQHCGENHALALTRSDMIKLPEMRMKELIDELLFLDKAHEKFRSSSFSPVPEDAIPLVELLRGHSKLASNLPVQNVSCLAKPWPCLGRYSKCWPYADLVFTLEYFKIFDVFRRLSADEQRLLVRRNLAVCAHLTTAYFSYKMKSGATYHPDHTRVWAECVIEKYKWQFHVEAIQRIRALALDEQEYVLVKALIVADPTMDGLSDESRAMLDELRAIYAKPLFSVMCAKSGVQRVRQKKV
ncbi:hypothetical protein PMAYCL1PPCAC_04835 [Pristionchus mayeri]|uniref:NR LBD domain-containing protein n=1 Tax=Pristionchus mayeri TaxID=1317129 RepID=A0AAN5C8I6_9BILA|nr:hypothetical protein PMAYCL1PPCAC_04835 [Pristionchus mayeri]